MNCRIFLFAFILVLIPLVSEQKNTVALQLKTQLHHYGFSLQLSEVWRDTKTGELVVIAQTKETPDSKQDIPLSTGQIAVETEWHTSIQYIILNRSLKVKIKKTNDYWAYNPGQDPVKDSRYYRYTLKL